MSFNLKLFYEKNIRILPFNKKNMKEFIKKVIEDDINEDDKLRMLEDVADKEISSQELAEIITYLKSKQTINLDLTESISICWTWWSGLDRINTSTLVCLKLAQLWIKVVKPWNNASSWRFGSFDLIEKLWYKVPNSEEEVNKEYEENNIVFLYAKNFYPFMKKFAEARKQYSKPTIFNIIWPLLSPVNSDYEIIGCAFEDKMELMIETCKILWRKNVLVIRWDDNLDEVTLTWKTKIYELKNSIISKYEIEPEDFGFEKVKLEEILEKDIYKKIKIAKKIITWKKVWSYSDLVDINVKVALKFLNK